MDKKKVSDSEDLKMEQLKQFNKRSREIAKRVKQLVRKDKANTITKEEAKELEKLFHEGTMEMGEKLLKIMSQD